MFGIGETEAAIILVFGFLLFGPDKLPEAGKTIGRALRQFREAQDDLTSVVQSSIVDPIEDVAKTSVSEVSELKDKALSSQDAPHKHTESFAEKKARLQANASVNTKESCVDDKVDTDKPLVEEESTSKLSAFDLYGLDSNGEEDKTK